MRFYILTKRNAEKNQRESGELKSKAEIPPTDSVNREKKEAQ
jgi:hypothetical protein